MKSSFFKILAIGILILTQSSCRKTYTCLCNVSALTGDTIPYESNQVKTLTKNRALVRCSEACPGGQFSIK
jgi:hypothetical protein